MKNRKQWMSLVLAVAIGAGCASKDHMKTQKQQATEQWNGARAAVLFSLAQDQFQTGNLDKARQTLDEAMAMEPTNANFHVLHARLDIEQGKLETALKTLVRVGELDEKNPEIDYLTGVIQQRWQRPDLALAAYTKAAEKNPSDIAYVMAEAETMVTLGRGEAALKLLEDRAVFFEHSAAIRDAIAQLHEQKGELDYAINYYRQASVLDGEDDGIRERWALAMYRRGMWSDALSQITRLIRKETHKNRADLMVVTGDCELELGNALAARDQYEAASRLDGSDVSAWRGIARSSLELNDVRRASLAVQRAMVLAENDAGTQMLMGLVQMRQDQLSQAARSFERAAQLSPTESAPLCLAGLALEKQGQRGQAAEMYRRALRVDPRDKQAGELLAAVSE
jgi:tetratricopeptide (TPR) repeat protein